MLLFFEPLMKALGATEGSMEAVKAYGILYLVGMILNVLNIMFNNLMVAEGDSAYSMATMLAGGCANMVLDPLLIFTHIWGLAGLILSQLAADLCTALTTLWIWKTERVSQRKLLPSPASEKMPPA